MLTFSIHRISLALILLLLTGCAQFNPDWGGDSSHYNYPYAQSDFEELLSFGDNMAKISTASRAKVCRTLTKRQKGPVEAGVYLHLMVGRLLSDACGEIPRILDGVASIPPGSLSDARIQKLITINTEALKRMNNVPRKIITQECKQKTVRSVQEPKDTRKKDAPKKEPTISNNNETRLLREKLEAIRSMEKHLDESGNAN